MSGCALCQAMGRIPHTALRPLVPLTDWCRRARHVALRQCSCLFLCGLSTSIRLDIFQDHAKHLFLLPLLAIKLHHYSDISSAALDRKTHKCLTQDNPDEIRLRVFGAVLKALHQRGSSVEHHP